ncbi:MAG: glycosyltransferase [Candidatus Competibacteraceae bacterium]
MAHHRNLPVFFDPEQKRWPRLRLGMVLVGLFSSALFGALILSILVSPAVPALDLPLASIWPHGVHMAPPSALLEHPLTHHERAFHNAKFKLEQEQQRSLQSLLAQAQKAPPPRSQNDPLAIGFFVNWDDSSFSSLKEHWNRLDMLIPEWLHLAGADGTLQEDEPEKTAKALAFIRERRPDMSIMPLVNNYDGKDWQGAMLGEMLQNPTARAHVIEQLRTYVENHGFVGVSIDFENIPTKAQPAFQHFIDELYAVFHPKNLLLSVNVPASDPAFNYRKLAHSTDYLILMAYDEHWSSGSPGPIAGMPWFARVLQQRRAEIPPEKTIVALGNYGYDWPVGKTAEEMTFEEAVITAKESEGKVHLDRVSLNPTFDYADDDNKLHHVWFMDAVTVFNQMVAARALQPRGFALWRMGSEDPSLWRFFGNNVPLDAERVAQLRQVQFGYDLDYEGQGEILHITSQPQAGVRNIDFDPKRGLITGEQFSVFPSPYVITRHGGTPRQIALTFDDGPDPTYTVPILDELKQTGVPATFFIIGVNGERYPELLRREADEGHEIGNHTFTHPDISTVTPTQIKLELSATQRLLGSVIKRYSLLFRPPYAVDSEPETPDQVQPIELAREQGYLTVGMQIDPSDWQRPGVDEIVQRTVEAAERGDGNIVLLHDAGGDRSQTVQALPKLIDALRNHGFQLVTISELLGHSHDEIMPPVETDGRWQVWMDGAAFGVVSFGMGLIHWLFLIGILLGIGRLLFIGALAVYQYHRKRRARFDPAYSPSVAVVIPAYNEEKVIVQTIASLLAGEHPAQFEIIVVDDGSKDATYRRAREAFAADPRVRVYTKANGGKPEALNFGVARTQADIIVTLDADTIFTRDTIVKLVRHFADPRVGAVAGNAKVGNRNNLLTRWQALEYITCQNLDRRAFDVLDCITVVPGAVGAWRRELIQRAGGFNHLTLAEDADMTMAIRKLGYSIVYEDEAIALTEAPDTVRGFIRQRYRWMFGTMQAAWKHLDVLFRRRYGTLGFVALPNVLIFQVLFPLISPIMDLLLLGSIGIVAFDYWQHPIDNYQSAALGPVLFYYALFVAVDFCAGALAFLLERRENKSLLSWLFWQRFFYRQLMYYVAIKATVASLKGIIVGWNKLERKATVQAQELGQF